MPSSFIKDPDAVLDYKWDWSQWLQTAETITTATFLPDTGITVNSNSHDNTTATIWLSGGTVGTTYAVVCRVVTNQGRTDDRTAEIQVRQR